MMKLTLLTALVGPPGSTLRNSKTGRMTNECNASYSIVRASAWRMTLGMLSIATLLTAMIVISSSSAHSENTERARRVDECGQAAERFRVAPSGRANGVCDCKVISWITGRQIKPIFQCPY
jgi:hypothetical protein